MNVLLAQEGYDMAIRLTRSLPGDVVPRLLAMRYLRGRAHRALAIGRHLATKINMTTWQ